MGRFGWHPEMLEPITVAAAVIRSAWAHRYRKVIIAPFEAPTM